MQLGTRWAAGADAPASVPAVLRPAIAEVEARGLEGFWTLTWLEGRPIAELDAGWEVFVTAAGDVVAREFQD
ncbi:Fe-S osidoreductase [Microbacterium sp. CH12i]|uniref:hypothetical protein n=1 Tax=Microbacterium sp. CH12i TaxID=1479651 RepID=UPI000461B351|nr:hypothetical protein [Microbacterium sp. CH12i]KDA06272.1 Fe-S osidoreductase [Microbacterium sp. CH12i]